MNRLVEQLQEKKWEKRVETFEDEDTHETVDVERDLLRVVQEKGTDCDEMKRLEKGMAIQASLAALTAPSLAA